MKSKKNGGSLFGLLAKNYLLFTLTLFVIAGGVYALWNARLNRIYEPVNWQAIISSPMLERGEYDKLSRRIRRDGYAFAVLDGQGAVLYRSDSGFDAELTAGELECVAEYASPYIVESASYKDPYGREYFVVTRYAYGDAGEYDEVASAVLDSRLRVVSGGLGDGRVSYTQQEYGLLTGSLPADSELYRYFFTDADGSPRTLLMQNAVQNDESFYKSYRASWQIWLLFVPLYLLAAGLFIWLLNRRMRVPLARLNSAIKAQTEGRPVPAGNCGGTSEIRQIGESFDLLSRRLAESEQERRALDEGRQKLIADISHDIKTPVTVISGYAGAICDGRVPPEEQPRYLSAIRQKAETLDELVNAFHEYSTTRHPDFLLHTERTDICELAREYLAKKYDEIDLAGFSLEVAIPEKPVYCMADPFQLRRVFDNLISNSLRYNRLGTVLFFDIQEGAAAAAIKIADNGAGIPPERRKDIFEPFVVGSDARNSGGSGLGLAITRRIVEKHGGTVILSPAPAPGRSTEFIIRLPVAGPEGK